VPRAKRKERKTEKKNLTVKKCQLDFGHYLNGQDFWLQLIHTPIIIQQPKYSHEMI
jgi:hypothetical protein